MSKRNRSSKGSQPRSDDPPWLRYKESPRWRNWLALANRYPHGMVPPGVRTTVLPGKRVRLKGEAKRASGTTKIVALKQPFRVAALAALPLPAINEFITVEALDKVLPRRASSIIVTTDSPLDMAIRIEPATVVSEYDDGTSSTDRRMSSGYLLWSASRAICEIYDELHKRGCRQLTQPGSLWIEAIKVQAQEGVVHLFMGT